MADSPKQGSLDGEASERRVLIKEAGMDSPSSLTHRKILKSAEKGSSASKLSLKEKKKSYRNQKKSVAREIMNSASDQSVILMADWLKGRGTLKSWSKLWCVCKPSMMVIYKTEKMKTSHWVGTILLNTCQLIQRPSKKEGFCFKLFHPLDQSIWATKGPKGETIGALVQPLPMSYSIFRAPSENQGKCWMDGLELALRCTSLIKRTTSKAHDLRDITESDLSAALQSSSLTSGLNTSIGQDDLEESEVIMDLESDDFDDDDHSSMELSGSEFELAEGEDRQAEVVKVVETEYVANETEELGQQGDASQTEEVDDENKSLIWTLVKQVRPGMDLSKVVLPTFILEPRSFLDKLSDYYYHADLLSLAVQQDTALERIKMVLKWYLSGFYKKPKGLKKPYNPIIGETFRCYWQHPGNNSKTFYMAEQISHHPPVSAFHVSNRHDGFNIDGCILAKSKFYGNSISAILDGVATLTFLERGEDYQITMPYAHCKGILLGTLTMEMGGKVSISCLKTGYHADLDFKLKPFFSNGEAANRITGRIRLSSEVLCTFEGHWDQQIYIKELTNREPVLFWDPTAEVRAKRLTRYTVPMDKQEDNESEKMWQHVSKAVIESDMHVATSEKHKLEEKQRQEAKCRQREAAVWKPRLFSQDANGKWIYKHADPRPWDQMTDCVQYEKDFIVQTQTVHTVPSPCSPCSHNTPLNPSLPTLTTHNVDKSNNHLPSDDSYSSDNNIAENSDDYTLGRNTNRMSSLSESYGGAAESSKQNTISKRHLSKNGQSPDTGRRQINPQDLQRKNLKYKDIFGKQLGTDNSSGKLPPQVKALKLNRAVRQDSKTDGGKRSPTLSCGDQPTSASSKASVRELQRQVCAVAQSQQEMQASIREMGKQISSLQEVTEMSHKATQGQLHLPSRQGSSEWWLVGLVLIVQTFLHWFFSH